MTAFLTPLPRLEGVTELLDRLDNSAAEIEGSLRDLELLNRCFGGLRTILLHLSRLIEQRPGAPFTVLDIATGAADVPRAICRRARRRGLAVEIEAVDRSDRAVAIATAWSTRYPEIRLRQAEVPPLSYPDRSFDYVIASLFLHHLTEAQAISLLREMHRVARYGLIVNDLRRSRPARFLTTLATHVLSRNRLTRHDGPVSILRGFRPEELQRMAALAGLHEVSVACHPWFRIALVAESPPQAREPRAGARAR